MVGDIFQPTHLLFVLVVALLVLGPKRLPEVGRTLGSGIRDFRQAISGESDHHDHDFVTAAQTPTEQRQQPASAADIDPQDTEHENAIGPITFDEPISFDSDAETQPVDTSDWQTDTAVHEPTATAVHEPADASHTSAETVVHRPVDTTPVVEPTLTPQSADTGQRAEPRAEQDA